MKIYLIDDQQNRQEKYGWNKERFAKYDFLSVFRGEDHINLEKLKSYDIVLFHESFPNKDIKKELYKHSEENTSFILIVFSGSKNQRNQNQNRIDMPVSVFYKNLATFLDAIKEKKHNVQYLLYGKKFNIEKEIFEEITKRNNEESTKNIENKKNNLLFLTDENYIERPFNHIDEANLYANDNNEFSDDHLDKLIKENLADNKYDNIYIPLCFGNVLSDFNGLRLALHIRFTLTKNQCTTIFIYGTPHITQFLDNPYFDILKTKNVFYIDYNKKSLQEAENKPVDDFTENELSKEISKIKLTAPKDNHSIANEWAISRWAKIIHADNEDIRNIIQKIENNLYYKYLQTTFPISTNKDLLEELNIKYSNDDEYSNEQPKILYIDDEHEKGWNKIFTTIFNNTRFESLNIDFSKPQEAIIQKAIEKIKKDFDTIILDFRLHQYDFEKNTKIEDITSVKLLQEIKKINAGIQVILFSATNKIWNLQKLQELGADGFIIKESPENSMNPDFTSETILQFKSTIETAFKKRFLKEVFIRCNEIKKISFENKDLDNEHKNEISYFLDIAFDLLYRGNNNYAYLQLFLIIEMFAKHILGNDTEDVYVGDICIRKNQEQSICFESGKYIIKKCNVENPKVLDINFQVSALLIYRYGNQNSSAQKWTNIYTNRNKKVSHYENGNEIKIYDIFEILGFLRYLLDDNNKNDNNKDKGLKIDEAKELQKLKDKFKRK